MGQHLSPSLDYKFLDSRDHVRLLTFVALVPSTVPAHSRSAIDIVE